MLDLVNFARFKLLISGWFALKHFSGVSTWEQSAISIATMEMFGEIMNHDILDNAYSRYGYHVDKNNSYSWKTELEREIINQEILHFVLSVRRVIPANDLAVFI